MKSLGKLLFPNSPAYEQRQKVVALLAAVAVGLAISGLFVLVAIFQARPYAG